MEKAAEHTDAIINLHAEVYQDTDLPVEIRMNAGRWLMDRAYGTAAARSTKPSCDARPDHTFGSLTDISGPCGHVGFAPDNDQKSGHRLCRLCARMTHMQCSKDRRFIRSVRRREAKKISGIVRPIAFAVFRLIAKSNFVGCSMGKLVEAGFARDRRPSPEPGSHSQRLIVGRENNRAEIDGS
jgi:hypothetical protein